MSTHEQIRQELTELSLELGREERELSILGEGNTSADCGDGTFWVKASGSQLGRIRPEAFTRVSHEQVLALMDEPGLNNEGINEGLEAIRLDPIHKRPSIETFLHALCMRLGGAKWVGHTHTSSMLKILCSEHGVQPFLQHIYPDVIVVCGRHIAHIPYVEPGLELAFAVRNTLNRYQLEHGRGPKLLLMQNHGPVALGQSASEVFNILLMADKWARALHGAMCIGKPRYLTEAEADAIDGRPDEDYRRKQLAASAG